MTTTATTTATTTILAATIEQARQWDAATDKASFVQDFLGLFSIDNPNFDMLENAAEIQFRKLLSSVGKSTDPITYTEFATLAEAVAAAGLDLSYNERVAQEEIRNIQSPPPRWAHLMTFKRALLLADGRVMYEITTEEGLRILNSFTPFCHVLDDCPFRLVTDVSGMLLFSAPLYKKTGRTRRALAATGVLVA
jgi:hypothetical protein